MRKSIYFIVVSLFICGAAAAAQPGVHEMQSYRTDGEFDRAAYEAEQQRLLAWLVADQVKEGLAAPVTIKLSEREIFEVESGICDGCQESASRALLAGMVKPVNLIFDLHSPTHGALRRSDDRGFVWTASIHSDDAAGLRVHFSDFSLPAGFELWLYSTNGGVRGPYTGQGPNGSGDFWSHTIAGPDAVLQLRGPVSFPKSKASLFSVTDLGHVGRGAALKTFCVDNNADCVVNGECYYEQPAVDDARMAIAHMQYVKRPYIYFCSGGLLNSSINPGTPYFLTANHCISRDREAGTLETYFQFTIDCDSNSNLEGYECPTYNNLGTPSTLGSTVVATNSTSDFTLLQLSQVPPGDIVFMGWTDAPVIDTAQTLYRISHPGGAPQAFSTHVEWDPNDVSTVTECSGWPRGQWIYSQDQVGATEGGSSGSPVVNAAGQVVGQLSGACGYALDDNCNNILNSTVDGAFAAYYDQVAPWLGSGGPCTDADNDGYCAEVDDCDDSIASVNPGVTEICEDGIDNDCDGVDNDCVPCTDVDQDGYCAEIDDCDDGEYFANPGLSEICDDGIDNNCDGDIDEGCNICLPRGAPCTIGSECCSGSCHPRKHTCK